MKKLLALIVCVTLNLTGFSAVFTVQNTNDAGIGSLRQAVIDAANDDSITFNPTLITGGNNTIVLTSGEIAFSKDLTFIGLMTASDTLFVSGNNSSRIFNINGATVVLDRMAIINGFDTSQGGGINAYILTVNNSVIRDNIVSGSANVVGGGIYAYNLTINNSVISENTAISSGSSANGGGMFSNYLTIVNSSITGNVANSVPSTDVANGGGFKASNVTIDNAIITGNLASGNLSYGGGCYVSGNLNMINSTVTDNTVSSGTSGANGGGIYAYASSGSTTLIINNSTFTGNTATSSDFTAYGGAIYARSNSTGSSAYSTMQISYSTIKANTISNTATNSNVAAGAGIYADDIYLTLDNTVVLENIASSPLSAIGGGIYATTSNSPSPSFSGLLLKNSVLNGNSTTSPTTCSGGGIYVISKSISNTSSLSTFDFTIDNSKVSDNSASSTSGTAYGGGIYANSTASQSSYNSKINAVINNSTISNNIATSPTSTCLGGGICARSNSNSSSSYFTFNNSTISNNSVSSSDGGAVGGGIYTLAGSSNSIFNLSFNQSTVYGNTASTTSLNSTTNGSGGGIFCASSANSALTINNSTITSNTASSNNATSSGGIHISTSTVFTIGSSIVAENIGDYNISGTISTSNGYNIFDDAPAGTVGTDQINVSSGALNLGGLQNNGGTTFTAAPGMGSVAIDMGNSSDVSDAQNGPVNGVRDVGAAEFDILACPILYDSISLSICNGDSYSFGGNVLTNTGIYKDTLTSVNGCDSVVTLNLLINNPLTGVDTQTACESFTWTNGNTYTANTTLATDTLTSVNGCDSVVTLYLIVNYADATTDTQTACGSYTWTDGNTYTTSNTTATQTLTNLAGCDSIVTLNLTITNSASVTDSVIACDSYTWIDGNTYTASNSTATHTYTDTNGCAITATLNLTLNNSVSATDTQIACSSYTWIDGNTYTADNNTATHTLVSSTGCDSLVTLDLTINDIDVSTTLNTNIISANESGATYQWLDCNDNYAVIIGETDQSYTALSNGDYAVVVTNINCTDTSACVNISGLGIDGNDSKTGVAVYPNPTSSSIEIFLSEHFIGKTFWLFDGAGKIVMKGACNNKSMILDLSHLESGIYYLKVEQSFIKISKL
ncbi:MAG: T9SS type A sorting domain-containing protein [Crocinitomicaceae bacterium]